MARNVSITVKYHIYSILYVIVFNKLSQPRKDFIVNVLWHILSIKGKINFLQLGRYGSYGEQTYRNQFEKKFDFFSFNKQLIDQTASANRVVAFDPSFIPKAGKLTYWQGQILVRRCQISKMGLGYLRVCCG
jgi:hypothetical protein